MTDDQLVTLALNLRRDLRQIIDAAKYEQHEIPSVPRSRLANVVGLARESLAQAVPEMMDAHLVVDRAQYEKMRARDGAVDALRSEVELMLRRDHQLSLTPMLLVRLSAVLGEEVGA